MKQTKMRRKLRSVSGSNHDGVSNEIIKPTLQSVVWLAELVATTSMKNESNPRKGPRLDQTYTKRILDMS